ncbi:MAG: hypothetical protein LLF97_10030 [Planctomycetaceae bacterium]|nr:hypothetical protein [Planctomycetaceae bacterium]
MSQKIFCKKMGAAWAAVALAIVCGLWTAAPVRAEVIRHSTSGDLFHNQYAPPVGCNSTGAQLYPCPRPAPARVGHTYITYQPLMPQEFLYRHHRCYITKHPDAPSTWTSVHWH